MSTIVVTPLVAGDTARSADVNATLASWNAGSAAGQIGAENVRVEGVDRRTMSASQHVVGSSVPNTNNIVTIGSTGAIRSTGLYSVVPGLITTSVTPGSERYVVVNAHVDIRSSAIAAAVPRLVVDVRLEQSTDNGVSWTAITGTTQTYRMRDTGILCSRTTTLQSPGIIASATWVARGGGSTLSTYLFRVAYRTTWDQSVDPAGTDVTFTAGTIFVEGFAA